MPAWQGLASWPRVKHGRFFTARARDCSRCSLASLRLSKGRVNKAVVIGDDYPSVLRARRRRKRWSNDDNRLSQRHRWRSEGFHGDAKTWDGLARAVQPWSRQHAHPVLPHRCRDQPEAARRRSVSAPLGTDPASRHSHKACWRPSGLIASSCGSADHYGDKSRPGDRRYRLIQQPPCPLFSPRLEHAAFL